MKVVKKKKENRERSRRKHEFLAVSEIKKKERERERNDSGMVAQQLKQTFSIETELRFWKK